MCQKIMKPLSRIRVRIALTLLYMAAGLFFWIMFGNPESPVIIGLASAALVVIGLYLPVRDNTR